MVSGAPREGAECYNSGMIPTSTNVQVRVSDKVGQQAEAVAVMMAEGQEITEETVRLLDGDLRRSVTRLREGGVAKGKSREVAVDLVGTGKPMRRLLVAGLGDPGKLSLNAVREAGGAVAKHARQNQLKSVTVVVPKVGDIGTEEAAGAVVEGFLLASFRYREYRGTAKKKGNGDEPVKLTVVAEGEVANAVRRAVIVAEAQNFARTIAFRPGNDINPVTLAAVAQSAAKDAGLVCRVMDEKQLTKLGMGGLLAVGGGSVATPPRLIVLEHKPKGLKRGVRPVLLVGKAITFDTGGISIKPAEKMGRMVFDKCGGMAVLGAMVAAARLKLPVQVVGLLAAAENHISHRAFRPGDLLRMYNGVTVEVTNTDAEGRLVLGDAMAWGIETYKPRVCVDLATLTGGVSVALGRTMAGIMANDQNLVDRLIGVGAGEGEKMWQLPMPEDPQEMLKSEFADIVNSAGRDAHPLQGAAFLSFFVPGDRSVPWAHLDIAGVADTDRELPLYSKGATGWGVRTLVRWLEVEGG